MRKYVLSLALLLISLPIFAATSLVKVNVIVFTRINNAALNSEVWPQFLAHPSNKFALNLAPTAANQATYKLLPSDINNTATRLNNAGYHVVVNEAWIQPANGNHPWVHIVGGQPYAADGSPTTAAQASYWQINGYLKLDSQGSFLADGYIFLTLPQNGMSSGYGLTALQSYRLATKLSGVKIEQFAYLDHPLFGVLIYLTRPAGTMTSSGS